MAANSTSTASVRHARQSRDRHAAPARRDSVGVARAAEEAGHVHARRDGATVTKHLKRGARIRIGGLGILQVRKRPARMGRNPATGEAIKIKASKKVAFRAATGPEGSGLVRFQRVPRLIFATRGALRLSQATGFVRRSFDVSA